MTLLNDTQTLFIHQLVDRYYKQWNQDYPNLIHVKTLYHPNYD